MAYCLSTWRARTSPRISSSPATTASPPCSDEERQVSQVPTEFKPSSNRTSPTSSDRNYSYVDDIESQISKAVHRSASLVSIANFSPGFSIKVPQWAYGTTIISLIIITYVSLSTLLACSFTWSSFTLITSIDFVYVLLAATLRYFFALHPRTLATGEPFTFRTYFSVYGFTSSSQDDNRLRLPPIVFMVLLALIFFLDAMIRDLPPPPRAPSS